jgi:hypothetical protein
MSAMLTDWISLLVKLLCSLLVVTTFILIGVEHAYSLLPKEFSVGSSKYYRSNMNQSNVHIVNIDTEPEIVRVNDNFTINATVVNSSPSTIRFLSPVCDEKPLAVRFHDNVIKHFKGICHVAAALIPLGPGEETSVRSPIEFKAISAGTTHASATFYYRTQLEDTHVSSSFVFTILRTSRT